MSQLLLSDFRAILKGLSVLFVLESGGTLTLGHYGLPLTSVLFMILLFVLFKRLNAKTMFLSHSLVVRANRILCHSLVVQQREVGTESLQNLFMLRGQGRTEAMKACLNTVKCQFN